jgi:OHCU decarboxylase
MRIGSVAADPDEEAFVARYGALFEHSPWVAREAFQCQEDDLGAAFEAALREAPRDKQLAVVQAHPELAGREAEAGELTEASASEQARAGLDRLTADELADWRSLNADYRERFGFPLVVCVREHTKDSILAWGRERLHHTPEEELDIAVGEVVKIARLRLEDMQ